MIYKQIKLNISLWGTWTGKTHLSRLWISPLYRCIRYNILWVGVTIFISVLIRMTPVHPLIITLSWWPSKNKTAQNWKNKSTGFFFSFLKVVIYISNDNFKKKNKFKKILSQKLIDLFHLSKEYQMSEEKCRRIQTYSIHIYKSYKKVFFVQG